MLYGRPLKHIRHADETTLTIGPQRFQIHTFWLNNTTGSTARIDGQDLKDDKACPTGSIITKHKLEVLMTPETIEPQQVYMGRFKLSFHDIYAQPIIGGIWEQASYGDTATENFQPDTNAITPHFFPDSNSTRQRVNNSEATDIEIGGSGSGFGIQEWKLDDNIHHFITMKKVTVFDQRPLMGERWQKVPAKVKRINPFTFYALMIFNDSVRGATPADTQVKLNIKSYYEELAI